MKPTTMQDIARERLRRHMDGSDGMPDRPEEMAFKPYESTGKPEAATHPPEWQGKANYGGDLNPPYFGPKDTSPETAAFVNGMRIRDDPEWGLSQTQRNQAAWEREQKKSDAVHDQRLSPMHVVSRKKPT